MSLTVKVNGRSPVLPGGGYEISGQASNDKEFVWGELSGTYVTSGITGFTAEKLGLSGSFDFLMLQPVTLLAAAGAGVLAATTNLAANFDETTSKIFMQTIDANGSATESTQTAYVVNFFACGTSAAVANLT